MIDIKIENILVIRSSLKITQLVNVSFPNKVSSMAAFAGKQNFFP
jgi:hypothetical protein